MKVYRRTSERVLSRIKTIRLTVRGKVYEFDLKNELRLTTEDSEDILLAAAERFMFWSRMAADLQDQSERIELELDEQKAHYAVQIGQSAKATDVRNQVKLQPKVMDLERRLLEVKHQCRVVAAIVAAFEYRKVAINKLWRKND